MTESEEQPRPINPLVPRLALAGAALLLAGTFCPAIVRPSGTALSYCNFQATDGYIVIGLAGVSFALTWVFQWYRGLFVTSGVALLMIGATLLKVSRAGFGEAALSWGWLPLLAGAVLLLAAALCAEKERRPDEAEESPDEEELIE